MPRGEPLTLLPPSGGQRSDIVAPAIPEGYLWRSENALYRHGEMILRPGLEKVVQTGPGGRPGGGAYFKTTAGSRRVVVGSLTGWKKLNGSVWTDITGTALSGDADNPVRFTVFPSGGTNYLIGVNNVNGPKVWDGAAATYSDLGGTPPDTARDVCVAANRVVFGNVVETGTRAPSRIIVSAFNNHASYPGLVADLPDTGDDIVAVRGLGRTAFMVYKDESQWLAQAQPGIFPFRFDIVNWGPGPVSPAAIVTAGPVHYFLATDARIYRCTGMQVEAVSDAVDKDLELSPSAAFRLINARRAWGVYRKVDHAVWFFYPGPNSSDPDRAVSLNIRTGAIHLHAFAFKLTCGWSGDAVATVSWNDLASFTWANIAATYPTWDSFGGSLVQGEFVGSTTGQVYRIRGDRDDDGMPIDAFWEYPPRAWAGIKNRHRLDAVEAAFEQVSGGPLVTIRAGFSEANAEPGDSDLRYVTVGQHDTTLVTRQLKTLDGEGENEGRFVSLRFEVQSSSRVHFRGVVPYWWAEAMA